MDENSQNNNSVKCIDRVANSYINALKAIYDVVQ